MTCLSIVKGFFQFIQQFSAILHFLLFYKEHGAGSVSQKRIRTQKAIEYWSNTDPDPKTLVSISLSRVSVYQAGMWIRGVCTKEDISL